MKVTVIVPIYNVQAYLERCIQSIVGQTYQNLEIILVDDGSTDLSSQMCDEYEKKDKRVKVIHKRNAGQGFARNDALDIATGEYVTFVDGDDFLERNAVELMLDATEQGKNEVVCAAIYNSWTPEKGGTILYSHDELLKGTDGMATVLADLTASSWQDARPAIRSMGVWAALYRLSIIRKNQIKFMSERIVVSEDLLFLYSLYPHVESIKYIPNPLYYYCLNATSTSRTFKTQYIDGLDLLMKLLLQSEWALKYEEIRKRIYKLYIYKASNLQSLVLQADIPIKAKLDLSSKIYNKPVWKDIYSSYNIKELPHTYRYYLSIFTHKRFFMAYIRQKLYKIRNKK